MALFYWTDDAVSSVSVIYHSLTGTTIAGHVDNVLRLQELCKQHDIWLHLRGHSLAALAMVSVQNVVSSIEACVKISVLWHGMRSSQVDRCQHFRGSCCLYHQGGYWRQQVYMK
jgi:hypothetical protein